MAGEHFEKIPLDLCNMKNSDLSEKKDFIKGIGNTAAYQ